MDEYEGLDYHIKVKCQHGIRKVLGWQLLQKISYCCQKGYHKQRVPPLTMTDEDRVKQLKDAFDKLDYDHYVDFNTLVRNKDDSRKYDVDCLKHGTFSQWTSSLRKGIGCSKCSKERLSPIRAKAALKRFHIDNKVKGNWVSKAETKWLDKLEITSRQVYLKDVKYKVDGYDKDTNTVYLYHGKFWHGCPIKYEPDFIHPIIKKPMKELYEKTLMWENKIKDAGYNLIVKWG